jgi:broad specificity phosphatase PhoE
VTGSFLTGSGLEGISDIDLVVIVDRLDSKRFAQLQASFRDALRPVLSPDGYQLRINPTLGPLKFNDPQTAVLHLMIYSQQAHVDHVVNSPFTCFDWQLSPVHRKRTLADVYPVFALQPHHFLSARRSLHDYLADYRARIVSYRRLQTTSDGYREVRGEKPMTERDRQEFAYHIMRFLMRNTLKLLQRGNDAPDADQMLELFFQRFPARAADFRLLYRQLEQRKQMHRFAPPLLGLDERLEDFVSTVEGQFRGVFHENASCHTLFRHAATRLNHGRGAPRVFLGRSDPPICPIEPGAMRQLVEAVQATGPTAAFVSPLRRCRQSLAQLSRSVPLPRPEADPRLLEIDYGGCEGLTADQARRQYPPLRAAWQRGEDPPFPGGESTWDVLRRAVSFVEQTWSATNGNTVACTHNVVLRCLVGRALAVPPNCWHRLQIPHLKPIRFVQTRDYGWFVDLDPTVEREIFADFQPESGARPKAPAAEPGGSEIPARPSMARNGSDRLEGDGPTKGKDAGREVA